MHSFATPCSEDDDPQLRHCAKTVHPHRLKPRDHIPTSQADLHPNHNSEHTVNQHYSNTTHKQTTRKQLNMSDIVGTYELEGEDGRPSGRRGAVSHTSTQGNQQGGQQGGQQRGQQGK